MHLLSILIVTTNSEEFIGDCLQSVLSQRTSFPVEVIVVDNSSIDGTLEIIGKKFPEVYVLRNNENLGFHRANNRGIRRSTGDVVLLLNPDTILVPDALERLLTFLIARDDVAVVGPKILNGDGSLQRTGVSFPSLWNLWCETLFLDMLFPRSKVFGRHRRLYEDPATSYAVDYLQGSCLMIKRLCLEAVGLLDEEYFMYFDEPDLCMKLKARGWKTVYVPEAAVIHFGASGATYYNELSLLRFHRSYLMFLRKHYAPFRRMLFRSMLVLRALIRSCVLGLASLVVVTRRSEFRERGFGYYKVLLSLLKPQ